VSTQDDEIALEFLRTIAMPLGNIIYGLRQELDRAKTEVDHEQFQHIEREYARLYEVVRAFEENRRSGFTSRLGSVLADLDADLSTRAS